MIITGEASGDLHGAHLVTEVFKLDPGIQLSGIGGRHMRGAGVEILADAAKLAVVGLVEVLVHYRVIKSVLEQMRTRLRSDPPDLLILIDYPDFNLRLAKTAKQCHIKVLYYIGPQIWEWRQGRVKIIEQRVDMMAVVFPFEAEFYRRHNIPVRFVGHPLVDSVPTNVDRDTKACQLGLSSDQPIIGLFPGSRKSEIKRLLPILVQTAKLLGKDKPDLLFVLPLASTLDAKIVQPYLVDSGLDIKLIADHSIDVIQACDAIITVSGTVTLEIALIGTPMVIINKVFLLTYLIVSRMLKIDHIGMCNIIANERIVPELIQHMATPKRIAHEVDKILDNKNYALSMRNKLGGIRKKLGEGGGSKNIAKLVMDMLK